jgi:hypothetical protein
VKVKVIAPVPLAALTGKVSARPASAAHEGIEKVDLSVGCLFMIRFALGGFPGFWRRGLFAGSCGLLLGRGLGSGAILAAFDR